jgi:serine/threonine-protein kinase
VSSTKAAPPQSGSRTSRRASEDRPDAAEPAPARLGPYATAEVVRTRGFTVTYAATHLALKRRVWLVTAAPTVGVRAELSRELERQAEVAARLGHDGVLGVYEIVRDGERVGVAFQAPEGPSLRELLDGLAPLGGARPAEVVALAVLLARAVARIHDAGIAHLALAPENVFFTRGGGVVLGALMEATPVREQEERREPPDAGPEVAYRAPERVSGEGLELASDVFSIGVMVHELGSGDHPFAERGASPASAPASIARRIRTAAPRPLVSDAVTGLGRVISRALEKLPALRYETASRLADDLESLLEEGWVPARIAQSCLARAGLIDAPPEPVRAPGPDLGRFALKLGAIGAAMVLVMLVLGGAGPLRAPASKAAPRVGYVKVLAHPWAEVVVDGEPIDTTPIGRPIAVSPGTHEILLRHPRAPDERRTVDVAAGETVVVDVVLAVERAVDAGIDTSP